MYAASSFRGIKAISIIKFNKKTPSTNLSRYKKT